MIKLLLLTATLSCPDTEVSNPSNFPWTKHDDKMLAFNKKQCVKEYPQSPCLVKFIKVRTRSYMAVCSKKR